MHAEISIDFFAQLQMIIKVILISLQAARTAAMRIERRGG
jgi:hypothetical protein